MQAKSNYVYFWQHLFNKNDWGLIGPSAHCDITKG